MLKGILRVFTGSFSEEDTLVLRALFRLRARHLDVLGLASGNSVIKLGGLDSGSKLR